MKQAMIQICAVRVMCLSEHSAMRMHACFSVVLSLTFMSTDNPHWLKCAISSLKSFAQVSTL